MNTTTHGKITQVNRRSVRVRGELDPQSHLFCYFSPESRVPPAHPLRAIKRFADEALERLSATFNEMYSTTGRPSIPPERLLKASLLIALYSIRSERLFCEMLDYNILFRWFLDMSLEESSFDPSTFSQNRERLIAHEAAAKFFDAVVRLAREEGLLSDEHFTVDGTLIEAWASLKSLRRKGEKNTDPPPEDPGNPTVDFRGESRGNATHASTTDPEARLMRKGKGKEAKLAFGAHALMENRNGLLVALRISAATAHETHEADPLITRARRRGLRVKTLGGDRGYHTRPFVARLRRRHIAPHLAVIDGRKTPGLDARTLRHAGYRVSQRKRKRIEEIFGWMKAIGGFRKTRFKGVDRTQLAAELVGAAYNLLRLSRLAPAMG